MTTAKFLDRFNREDGEIGPNYTIPCGAVMIFDEGVLPVTTEGTQNGDSPRLGGTTSKKTQVLYTEDDLDGADYAVRAVWSHLGEVIGYIDIGELTALATEDPSFTLLARMTKDPLLVDLGRAEDPACFDQGYGLRVTCPRDGSPPTLKLIKFATRALPPGVTGPTTGTEADGAFVLASIALTADNLNADPADLTTVPYRGAVQSMRLRIRRADDRVILEAYLNERHIHTPILSHTDYAHPLWGSKGRPGFEFLSATTATQPSGSSPYGLQGIPLMICHLFEVETVKDIEPSRVSMPANWDTYSRIAQRVILLAERNGDAKYTSSLNGQRKLDVYMEFVIEAEKNIIRKEGYFEWLYREERIYLKDGQSDYELPENCGLINFIRPGSWSSGPLQEATRAEFSQNLGNSQGGGSPVAFTQVAQGPNNRRVIRVYPIPKIAVDVTEQPHLTVEYYARPIRPYDPESQLPFVPQEHTDILIYRATSLALLLDTDADGRESFRAKADELLADLRRANNRKASSRVTVMRSVADTNRLSPTLPMLRASQLMHLVV